jgi:uncharacterized Fe-S center protein
MYSNKVNKLKPMSLLLHQPLSQPASLLVAIMWIAGSPSDAVCYHKHTLLSLPDVLHISCCHTYHIISQRPFGIITLIDCIPLKYYACYSFSLNMEICNSVRISMMWQQKISMNQWIEYHKMPETLQILFGEWHKE